MSGGHPGCSLVVGGTGMLAEATQWLADQSTTTLLVARHASRFAVGDRRYLPTDLDWQASTFQGDLTHVLRDTAVTRALLWLHYPERVIPWLLPQLSHAFVVLVLGNTSGCPQVPDGAARIVTVRLGSKPSESGGRRWLTDREISEGAISAFMEKRSQIVGDLLRI